MFGKCIFVMGQSKWLIATPKKKNKKEEEENQTLRNECTL
jgi:hypothetical protein